MSLIVKVDGRTAWTAVVNVPRAESDTDEWFNRRIARMAHSWGGEMLADAIVELGAELVTPSPLPSDDVPF